MSQVNNIKIRVLTKDDWSRFLNHHYVLQKRVERKLFVNRKVADENAKLILMCTAEEVFGLSLRDFRSLNKLCKNRQDLEKAGHYQQYHKNKKPLHRHNPHTENVQLLKRHIVVVMPRRKDPDSCGDKFLDWVN